MACPTRTDKKKRKQRRPTYKKKQPYGYQPNNPLTQHYITTGAILPEKQD